MACANGQGRAPPGRLFRGGDVGVEFGGLPCGAIVLPCDGRGQRMAIGVDEHVGVDLAAKADCSDTFGEIAGQHRVHSRDDAVCPVARILLHDSRRRARRPVRTARFRNNVTFGVEQRRLDQPSCRHRARQKGLVQSLRPFRKSFSNAESSARPLQRRTQCGRTDDDAVCAETDGRAGLLPVRNPKSKDDRSPNAFRPAIRRFATRSRGQETARGPVRPGTAWSMTYPSARRAAAMSAEVTGRGRKVEIAAPAARRAAQSPGALRRVEAPPPARRRRRRKRWGRRARDDSGSE